MKPPEICAIVLTPIPTIIDSRYSRAPNRRTTRTLDQARAESREAVYILVRVNGLLKIASSVCFSHNVLI